MKQLIVPLLIFCIYVQAADGGFSLWPSHIIAGVAGQAAQQAVKQSQEGLNQLASQSIARCDEVLLARINQMLIGADLLLLKAHNEGRDLSNIVSKTMAQDMQAVIADALVKAREQMQPMGQELMHGFTVDLAQNVAKALLVSTLGIFGAVVAYQYLKAYVACQQELKPINVRWHELKLAHYQHHPSSKAARFLLTRFKKLQLIDSYDAQQVKAQTAQGGAALFALACVLCCCWIR